MLNNTIKVSPRLHNFFVEQAKKYSDYYPHVYLIGKDRHDIMQKRVRLRILSEEKAIDHCLDSCSEMPALFPKTIIEAMVKIYDAGLIPSGFAFIGDFEIDGRSMRVSILQDLKVKEDGCVLSYNNNGVFAEDLTKELSYAVAEPKQERRGGDINGKRNQDKAGRTDKTLKSHQRETRLNARRFS